MTVVITCFNYGRFLPEAVYSVLSQEGVEADIVIVDDASVDDSADVASNLRRLDPRVRLIVNGRNVGAVESFNRGLSQAEGEYLVRLDADDVLTPGSLRRAVDLMQAFPEVGMVYGRPVHFVDGAQRRSPRLRPRAWLVWRRPDWLIRVCASGVNVITSPEVVIRRSAACAVGPMAPLQHAHDFEWWLRLAAVSAVGYVTCDQAWHREHGASLSATTAGTIVERQERLAAFEAFFASAAARNVDAQKLRHLARRALSQEAVRAACHHYNRGYIDTSAAGELAAFAVMCDPDITSGRLWSAWERRRSLGPRKSARRIDSVLWALLHGVGVRARSLRWSLMGLYR